MNSAGIGHDSLEALVLSGCHSNFEPSDHDSSMFSVKTSNRASGGSPKLLYAGSSHVFENEFQNSALPSKAVGIVEEVVEAACCFGDVSELVISRLGV